MKRREEGKWGVVRRGRSEGRSGREGGVVHLHCDTQWKRERLSEESSFLGLSGAGDFL